MTEQQFEIKDSGERRKFETGATRDVDYDKPRFDLIPTTVLEQVLSGSSVIKPTQVTDNIKARMWNLGMSWGHTGNDDLLVELIVMCLGIVNFQEEDQCLSGDKNISGQFHLISPKTYYRLAMLYGGGAKKYDPWNWSKGMELSVFHASLMRHIDAIIGGDIEEDHVCSVFFNAAAIIHFKIIERHDLDDVSPRLRSWGTYEDCRRIKA